MKSRLLQSAASQCDKLFVGVPNPVDCSVAVNGVLSALGADIRVFGLPGRIERDVIGQPKRCNPIIVSERAKGKRSFTRRRLQIRPMNDFL